MMLRRFVEVALLFAGVASSQATTPVKSPDPNAPLVDVGYAKFQGYTSNRTGINYFRGIQCVFFAPTTSCSRPEANMKRLGMLPIQPDR